MNDPVWSFVIVLSSLFVPLAGLYCWSRFGHDPDRPNPKKRRPRHS